MNRRFAIPALRSETGRLKLMSRAHVALASRLCCLSSSCNKAATKPPDPSVTRLAILKLNEYLQRIYDHTVLNMEFGTSGMLNEGVRPKLELIPQALKLQIKISC